MPGAVCSQHLYRGWNNSDSGSIDQCRACIFRGRFTQKTFSKVAENITQAFTSLNTRASSFLGNKDKFELQHTVQNADALYFSNEATHSYRSAPQAILAVGRGSFPQQHHT